MRRLSQSSSSVFSRISRGLHSYQHEGAGMGKEVENAEENRTLPKAFPNRPARIAHRGDIWSGPENTMSAFTGAVNKGCEGIEMDIRRTADGKIVVAHDAGFARVMCGSLEIERRSIQEMTLDQVCQTLLPFAGHLLDYFPEGGFENELYAYFPGIWTTGKPFDPERCSA